LTTARHILFGRHITLKLSTKVVKVSKETYKKRIWKGTHPPKPPEAE